MTVLPYLTSDLPGIGGEIKQRVEDFRVAEIPLYEPCGAGTHVYFRIEKRGIPTPVAVSRLAKYMGVRSGDIGVAGLKDAMGISSQMMSLEHTDSEKLAAYGDSQMRVVQTSLHTNKLRTGHLAGNFFNIKIRGVGAAQLEAAKAILDVLVRRGVPNYFGSQRFGARGDTAMLGRALLCDNLEEFVAIFLGRPMDCDPPDCKAARDAFDVGTLDRALKRWPRHYADQRKALAAYKKKRRPGPAVGAIDKRMKRFFISAFQSAIFNDILAERIESFDQVLLGDFAKKTDGGGVFCVEDLAVEQVRAEKFEISPTGILPGSRSKAAGGLPGEIENRVIAAHGVSAEQFGKTGSLKVKGARRALRYKLEQPAMTAESDEHGEFIEFSFGAPSGCYATVAVEEITKNR